MSYRRFALFPSAALLLVCSAGCIVGHPDVGDVGAGGTSATGGSGGDDTGAAAAGGTTGDSCRTTGAGRVQIEIEGLPAGVDAGLLLTGPLGSRAIVASTVIEGIAAGQYQIASVRVADYDPIVRTVYEHEQIETEFCLVDSTTHSVSVSYQAVPTSHRLWTNNSNGTGNLLAFSAASLAVTTSAEPDVSALAAAGKDVTFDAEGNLWSMGATVADPHLMRFSRAGLGVSGEKLPDRSLNVAGVECLPAMRAFAFDRQGSLWVSTCGDRISMLAPGDLEAGGEVTPAVTLSGLGDYGDIAFDIAGNLWVTAVYSVRRYDAGRLALASELPADLAISVQSREGGPALAPSNLAFDVNGNLWVIDFGGNLLSRIAATELEGSGEKIVVAAVTLALFVSALLERPAFDESGGLWLSLDQNRFGRLSPEQLGVSTTAGDPTTPETIITSPNMGNANRMAFYPAPADLPLYHHFR